MSARVLMSVLVLLSFGALACAQGGGAPTAAGEVDPVELMRQMGVGEENVLKFQLFSQLLGPEASPLLLLMMMEGQGDIDEDALPILLLMRAAGSGGGSHPAAATSGNRLFIIEDGTVYVLNMETLKLEGSVAYRPTKAAAGVPEELLPMLQQARGKAEASACLSNMKQLCLGAMMYAQDWDETFPSEEWTTQLEPYLKNRAIYACPGVPDRAVGFALNEVLVGAKLADIKRPSETVLFFESGLPDDLPFGGADGVLAEPRHEGRVTVGFADGHAKLMPPDEVRKLLEQDPFQ